MSELVTEILRNHTEPEERVEDSEDSENSGNEAVPAASQSGASKGKKKKKKSKKSKKKQGTSSFQPGFKFHDARARLIAVRESIGKGRGLFATDRIPIGTCVLVESSGCVIPCKVNTLCTRCLRRLSSDSSECINDGANTSEAFCSQECLDAFIPQRDFECDAAARLEMIAAETDCDLQLLRIVLRTLSWSHVSSKSDELFVDDGEVLRATVEGFRGLHASIEQHPASWVASLSQAFEKMLPLIPTVDDRMVTVNDALRIASAVNTNAYGCEELVSENFDLKLVAVGVFPVIGMTINHDCYPNCAYFFQDGRLYCRAIRDIPAGDEICVSYIDPWETHPKRVASLQRDRHFVCNCTRCVSYMTRTHNFSVPSIDVPDVSALSGFPDCILNGVYCDKCGIHGAIVTTCIGDMIARCITCSTTVSVEDVQNLFADASDSYDVLRKEVRPRCSAIDSGCIDMVEKWLLSFKAGEAMKSPTQARRYHGLRLHPSHILVLKASMLLSYLQEAESLFSKSVALLRSVLETVTLILPENYPYVIGLRVDLLNRLTLMLRKSSSLPPKLKMALLEEKNVLSSKLSASRRLLLG